MKGDHTKHHPGFSVSYWRKGIAVGMEDDWDTACVEAYGDKYSSSFSVDTRYDLGNLVIVLDKVFFAGKKARSKEINNLIWDGSSQ